MRSAPTVPKWHAEVTSDSKMTLVVMDMQKLFLTDKKSPWHDGKLLSIVPKIQSLLKAVNPENVIFTQFIPPKNWQNEHGSWQTYYKINQGITGEMLGTDSLDVVDKLLPQVLNRAVLSTRKTTASVFTTGNFHSKIKKKSTKFLIFTGIETDYCVLSSVLDAIHLGYYVIVVMDACASSKKYGQRNAKGIFERFPEQLWITTSKQLIRQLQKPKSKN
ncbi:cysteine hydrolase family protein [Nitrosopumilus sp.]|uniref:isochorismatase family cysteine hydrolase n=1 Tax=Nitrosopumilus sp. TaxID=2024843 RepID=UPI00292F5C45|nr:cysteine hydrolase family protein [Nitrosopumilus sp.]